MSYFFKSILLLLILPGLVWAGGAVERRKQSQKKMMQQQQMKQQEMQRHKQSIQAQKQLDQAPVEPAEIVDLNQLIDSLETSSLAWSLIIDQEAKMAVVLTYIDKFQKQGVLIKKSPQYYANMIDSMSQNNPSMLEQPFDRIFQVISIMEYDFENGQNKDAMALKILGSQQAVLENKKRLGLK